MSDEPVSEKESMEAQDRRVDAIGILIAFTAAVLMAVYIVAG